MHTWELQFTPDNLCAWSGTKCTTLLSLVAHCVGGKRGEIPPLPWFSCHVTTNTPADTREVPHKEKKSQQYVWD